MVGGNEDAIFMLGMIYYNGYEVDRDYKEAMGYFKDYDRLKDDSEAEYMIGCMYAAGEGVEENEEEAKEWFLKAAKKNHEGAKTKLKEMFGEDFNVKLENVSSVQETEPSVQENKQNNVDVKSIAEEFLE